MTSTPVRPAPGASAEPVRPGLGAAGTVLLGAALYLLLAYLCTVLCYGLLQVARVNAPTGSLFAGLGLAIPLSLYALPALRRSLWVAGAAVLAGMVLIAVSIAISVSVMETQWDALWYHQEIAIQLREGWNPIYDQCKERVPDILPRPFVGQKWWRVQCNSKAPYYFGVGVYELTGRIEAAKCTGVMLILASLLTWVSLALQRPTSRERLQGILLAVALSLSPAAASQWHTAYVDGQMASLLAIAIGMGFFVVRRQVSMLAPVAAVALIVGSKASAVVFLAAALVPLAVAFWYFKPCAWRDLHLIRWTALTALLVLLTGLNPLLTNTIRFHHPLYPYNEGAAVRGENLPDEMRLRPWEQLVLPAMGSFCRSLHKGDTFGTRKEILAGDYLKNPFRVSGRELLCFGNADVRVGGWGPLFPAIVLVSLFAGLLLLDHSWKAALFWFVGFAVVYASMVPLGMGFYARYNVQWWLVMFLPVLYVAAIRVPRYSLQLAVWTLLALAAVNGVLIAQASARTILRESRSLQTQLDQADRAATYVVTFWPNRFHALRKRLEENGIKYREVTSRSAKSVEKLAGIPVISVEADVAAAPATSPQK